MKIDLQCETGETETELFVDIPGLGKLSICKLNNEAFVLSRRLSLIEMNVHSSGEHIGVQIEFVDPPSLGDQAKDVQEHVRDLQQYGMIGK